MAPASLVNMVLPALLALVLLSAAGLPSRAGQTNQLEALNVLPGECDFPYTYKGEVYFGCMAFSKRQFCMESPAQTKSGGEQKKKKNWIRCPDISVGIRVDEVAGAVRASTCESPATCRQKLGGMEVGNLDTNANDILINEVMPKAKSGDLSPDWVELRNKGSVPVDVRGLKVLNKDALESLGNEEATASESESESEKEEASPVFSLECSEPLVIPPSGYLILFSGGSQQQQRNQTASNGNGCDISLPFRLSSSKDSISILHKDTAIDTISWSKGEIPRGASFGRPLDSTNPIGRRDSNFAVLKLPTPLKPNFDVLGENPYGTNYFGGDLILNEGAGTVSNMQSTLPIAVLKTFSTKPIPNYPKVRAELWISGCRHTRRSSEDSKPDDHHIVWNLDDTLCSLSDEPMFDDEIGIEVRGRSSQKFPKKQFSLELWSPEGDTRTDSRQSSQQQDFDYAIAGMPENADWILNGDYIDRSLLRNPIAMEIWNSLGYWAPRQIFVELFMWGPDEQASRRSSQIYKFKHEPLSFSKNYNGIYALRESIKRSKGRMGLPKLEIANLTTRAALSPTPFHNAQRDKGAYMLEFRSVEHENLFRQSEANEEVDPHILDIGQTRVYFKYPKQPMLSDKRYIKDLLTTIEDVLLGGSYRDEEERFTTLYSKYIDLDSFVDYFIHTEVSKNMDGFISSTYFSVDLKEGKLVAGPPWDFDLAFGNGAGWDGYYTGYDQWAFKGPNQRKYSRLAQWYTKLLQDPVFKETLTKRWNTLRQNGGPLSDRQVRLHFESNKKLLRTSISRNVNVWPLNQVSTQDYRIPLVGTKGSWDSEVSSLETWIKQRLGWMDKELERYSEGRALSVRSLDRTFDSFGIDDSAYTREQPMFPLIANIRDEIRDTFYPNGGGYGLGLGGLGGQFFWN
jgi:hypothetical protein